MNRFHLRTLSLLALAVVAAPALSAQESTGQIVGTVATKDGQPVAGAVVRLTSPAMQGVRSIATDAKGAYRAPLLPPGTYTLTVTKEGYATPKATLEVLLGGVHHQDIVAVSSAAGAVVEVVAAASSADKTDVKTTTTITSDFMDLIPRTTRGLDTAALLAPGVTQNSGQGNRVQIRGGQTTGNRFLLNGTDIADNVFGNSDGRAYFVDDSIQETQVIQSPVHARYGNFTGGIINAITKSGSNEFQAIYRTNVNRSSWSAQQPRGMRPGVTPSNAGTTYPEDIQARTHTLWVGGPILKDHLWFALSTKLNPKDVTAQNFTNAVGLFTGDGSNAAAFGTGVGQSGGPFSRIDETTFYELKLTYALNPNHTLELAGNKNKLDQVNRFYVSSFDPDTLVPQTNENDYKTLSYRGLLGTSATIEARWSKKHQALTAGGDPAKGDPIRARYSNGTSFIFQNGIFNHADGGDNRDITTWTANGTWYSPETAVGSFQVDGGFEFLYQDRAAANDQSPTQRQFFVWGRNADGTYRVAGLSTSALAASRNIVRLYSTDRGTAKTDTLGYYVNGLWTVNKHWQFMAGGRYDKITSKDTLGSQTISSSRFSPRFQAKYDLTGDQAWVASGSFARYAGKLNDSFTNRFTRAGNPITEGYVWAGARNDAASYATVTNLANWNVSASGLIVYSGPLSRFTAKDVKAPYTDETSVGLRHNLKDGSFLGFTFVKRKGGGFFNDFYNIGDEVVVPLTYATGTQRVIAERWNSDDRLTRDYKGFEFEYLLRLNSQWNLGGNYSYAILRGNSEGSEGNNPPVSGDVIGDYESVHASRGRGFEYYAPEGYLQGDQRHRMKMFLSYSNNTAQGANFYGSLLFNYDGGADYSLTRTLAFEAQADAASSPVAGQYPTTYTRYYGPRGIGRFNDTFGFDLKLGYDVPVVKRLHFFAEVTVLNLFNHWQVSNYDTGVLDGSGLLTGDPLAGFRAQPLLVSGGNSTGFGTYGVGNNSRGDGLSGTAYYLRGRSVVLSTGFKW